MGPTGPTSYSPGPYGNSGSPPHHAYPGGPYGVSPPQSGSVYGGQEETMFTYRGGGQPHPMAGDVGQERGGVVDGSVYGLYGVPPPQHAAARLSPGAYGNAQFPNARGTPQVYEFEYEEPRFT